MIPKMGNNFQQNIMLKPSRSLANNSNLLKQNATQSMRGVHTLGQMASTDISYGDPTSLTIENNNTILQHHVEDGNADYQHNDTKINTIDNEV